MSASSPEDVQCIKPFPCACYIQFLDQKSINDLILPPPIQWICSHGISLCLSQPHSPLLFTITESHLNCCDFPSSTCVTTHRRCVWRRCVGAAWTRGEGKWRTKRQAGSSDAELRGVMEDDIMVLGQSCCGSPSPPQVCSIWHACLAAVSQRKDRMFSREDKRFQHPSSVHLCLN